MISLNSFFSLGTGDQSLESTQASTVVNASAPIGSAVTSRDLRRSRRCRPRARTSSPPPSATVQSLMEMGFPRKAVEHAAKALGGIGEAMTPSPESIVGWLLEHQALVNI